MVFRVYVEKKPGFDVEAQQLGTELKTILGIDGLRKVRIVNRYDVEGISQELFEQATPTVFSEPQVDDALRAGLIARAAADAAALVDLGHAVGVQRDRAEAADLHARTAAGAAVEAKIVALRALVGAAAAVAVDAGNLGRELLSDFHLMQPPRYLRA